MKRRILGFIGFVILVILVGLIFQYTPQKAQMFDPAVKNVSQSVDVPQWFGQADMVAAGLMPMASKVRCFHRSSERDNIFSQSWSTDPGHFRAVSKISYSWCHNLQGRDWARPYRMESTILYVRKLCVGDRPLHGFRVTNYFRDGFRKSKNWSKKMWQDCHQNGFSARSRYLPKRATKRMFNVKNIPPYVINKIVAVYNSDFDGTGRKRIPFFSHSTTGQKPGGVPL